MRCTTWTKMPVNQCNRTRVRLGIMARVTYVQYTFLNITRKHNNVNKTNSLKVCSWWCHNSCKPRTISLSVSNCLSILPEMQTLVALYTLVLQAICNNTENLWGDTRPFVPCWPNIAGDGSPDLPASPVALTPMIATPSSLASIKSRMDYLSGAGLTSIPRRSGRQVWGLPLTSSFILEYSSKYLNEYSSTR